MSKIILACSIDEIINGMIKRIAKLEGRLDDMERSFSEHVLNDKIHIQHKSYKVKRRDRNSPPPPPPQGSNNHGFIIYKPIPQPKRQTSAPARMQTPVNDGISKDAPPPPPLPPNKLKL